MATFDDSIEATFLSSVYVTRTVDTPDASGNYGTTVTTITHGMLGDVQPARPGLPNFRRTPQGIDYQITHSGFFTVPTSVPAVNDTLIDGSTEYTVRAQRNFVTHLELDLEELGV